MRNGEQLSKGRQRGRPDQTATEEGQQTYVLLAREAGAGAADIVRELEKVRLMSWGSRMGKMVLGLEAKTACRSDC
jgi:hypothetical protein